MMHARPIRKHETGSAAVVGKSRVEGGVMFSVGHAVGWIC